MGDGVGIYSTNSAAQLLTLALQDGYSCAQLFDSDEGAFSFSMSWDSNGNSVVFYQNGEEVSAYCFGDDSTNVYFATEPINPSDEVCTDAFDGSWYMDW